jgi:O-antigen ligase
MPVLQNGKPSTRWSRAVAQVREPQAGVFFWLSAFYVVYCARPEDWIPGLAYIPLAKISGIFALVGLLLAAGKTKRGFRDLPREAQYLVGIILLLFVAGVLSPIWKGGAISKTLDFCKLLVAWVLTFFVVTNLERLRRIMLIQCGSVGIISVVSVLKGRSHPRLEGVIGGIYSNPNDLAFAIVLSLPFCFAFLLRSRSVLWKLAWVGAMLAMCTALFMTASRAGFIDLMVTGAVCLWIFGIKGKRIQLVAAAVLVALVIGVAAGGRLQSRFLAISADNINDSVDESAHDSYQQRRFLMFKAGEAMLHYPWGLGVGNFVVYSGAWREVHTSYLQLGSEGGLGALALYLLFFARGFGNLRRVRRFPAYDAEMQLFAGALYATLVGFLVGSLFAPEAYQYFPYFAVAYTSVMLAMAREAGGEKALEPKRVPARWSTISVEPQPVRDREAKPDGNGKAKPVPSPSAALRDLR